MKTRSSMQWLYRFIPEIIIAKKAVVLRLLDGDVNGSCSGHAVQEVPDANGLVGAR